MTPGARAVPSASLAVLAPSSGWAQSLDGGVDIRVWEAVIAGGVVVTGWFVTFFIQEYRRARERTEQRRELQSALRAEITDFEVRYSFDEWEGFAVYMSDAIIAGGDSNTKFRVFVPEERNTLVFSALKDRITLLDFNTTDPVIWYYSQISDVEAFAGDLRSEAFNALPALRRAQAYRHYIQMIVEAKRRARMAISNLNEVLGDVISDEDQMRALRRAERAAALRDWINNRAGGQNDL